MARTPAKRILVALDFSPCSRLALEHAAFLKEQFRGRVTVVHVVTHVPELEDGEAFLSAFAGESPDSFRAQARERAREEVRMMLEDVGDIEVSEVRIELGRPADVIVDVARELEADLIVMGTRGRAGLRRVTMGSVAEHVLRQAPCPVLTVRSPHRDEQHAYA